MWWSAFGEAADTFPTASVAVRLKPGVPAVNRQHGVGSHTNLWFDPFLRGFFFSSWFPFTCGAIEYAPGTMEPFMAQGMVPACRDNRPWSSTGNHRKTTPDRLAETGPIYGFCVRRVVEQAGRIPRGGFSCSVDRRGVVQAGFVLEV